MFAFVAYGFPVIDTMPIQTSIEFNSNEKKTRISHMSFKNGIEQKEISLQNQFLPHI